jgi:DNA-binding NarL/FixJ family response regulator
LRGDGDVVAEVFRAVIADDDARMRRSVRAGLESGGCRVVGEAATADEAIRLTFEHRPEVVLLDIHMPGNGIRAAQEVSRSAPDTAIVMLTQSREDDDLFDSLRAGAQGYLLKGTDPSTLVDVLRGVLAGEAAMPPALVTRVLDEFRAPARRRFGRSSPAAAKLSAREWEVMDLLARGLTTEQVATRLFVSRTTVRVHVSSVLRKLAVRDRESALRLLSGE